MIISGELVIEFEGRDNITKKYYTLQERRNIIKYYKEMNTINNIQLKSFTIKPNINILWY